MGHSRLLKYSRECCWNTFEAISSLTRPFLPGGSESRLTSTFPNVDHMRYASKCAQCGEENQTGKPGRANTIWAHKFYCLSCTEVKEQARCEGCGRVDQQGQMGHAGTSFARSWYCASCWKG